MSKKLVKTDVFYYSRKKLVFYLLFNLGLLSLALFFTWVIFPQYEIIYSFALITCLLSVLAIIVAMIIRHPLAVITSSSIKIDFCAPLKWKDIKIAHKEIFGHKELIIFDVKNLSKYKLNLMQKLIKNSKFSAFSIPLYAMDFRDAEAIERIIEQYVHID